MGAATTAGAITSYTKGITAGASPYGVAVGPDKNIWFTELFYGRIGKVVLH
jgi:streptogramin lyase